MQAGSDRWTLWMRRALQLAALAEGQTSPNPMVGAVVLAPLMHSKNGLKCNKK